MVASCPVCEASLAPSDEHCGKCGFPTALGSRLDGPVAVPVESESSRSERPVGRGPLAPDADGLEAEVNASLARALEERTELLRTLDRDAPDVTGELCEAALNEASGRVGDAQQVLRSAQGRLHRETEELLGRHLENLESRGRLLESAGLRLALESELARLGEAIVTGVSATSVGELVAAERRMDGIESRWRGLQALIAQVTALREQAAELGLPLERVPDPLAAARASLAARPATERDLDTVAQAAAESLRRLHEAIPPALEEELARHASALEAPRGRPARVQRVRHRHAEAVQHLRSGRLEDAIHSVRELRLELEELAREVVEVPEPPAVGTVADAELAAPDAGRGPEPAAETAAPFPEPPAVPAPPAPTPEPPAVEVARPPGERGESPPDAAVVATLMKKARSLAVRVRSLPADSPQAETAARQIHEATELLRRHRFAEADAALSRLMRDLVGTGSRS